MMMLNNRRKPPEFSAGDKVTSLVFHPPEISSGTEVTIKEPHRTIFYAVMLPNDKLHRWFADFELERIDQKAGGALKPGTVVAVSCTKGHPPLIKKGMLVRIEKVFTNTYLYDVLLAEEKYHRWLAEFELVRLVY